SSRSRLSTRMVPRLLRVLLRSISPRSPMCSLVKDLRSKEWEWLCTTLPQLLRISGREPIASPSWILSVTTLIRRPFTLVVPRVTLSARITCRCVTILLHRMAPS
ncbi:hypothetical protein BGZ65_001188, partial [Modicella reniformis]